MNDPRPSGPGDSGDPALCYIVDRLVVVDPSIIVPLSFDHRSSIIDHLSFDNLSSILRFNLPELV
jgi:hypothetical protein